MYFQGYGILSILLSWLWGILFNIFVYFQGCWVFRKTNYGSNVKLVCFSFFVFRFSFFVIRYSFFVIRFSLFVFRYSFFVFRFSFFVFLTFEIS